MHKFNVIDSDFKCSLITKTVNKFKVKVNLVNL